MADVLQYSTSLGKIGRPCVVRDMPLEVYHSQCCVGPSVSSTNLRRALECNDGSPAHFFCEWSGNPERVVREDKPHFALGRAVHHLMLGEKNFAQHFAIRPEEFKDWRTAASREWRQEQQDNGLSVVTADDIETIRQMSASLGKVSEIRMGLLSGQIERSMFWRDKETGLWCKVRPDAVPTDSGDFADLKTTTAVQYSDLANAVRNFAYHQQAALIAEAAKIVLGIEMSSFTFVFVEKTPPYCVRLLNVKKEWLQIGHDQNVVARWLIAMCLKKKHWPGPGEGHIVNIELGEHYRNEVLSLIERLKQEDQ